MAEWKHDPLALLSGKRLLQNPDPDAKASLDRYHGTGTKAWKKYGEFLEPIKPGETMHNREEPDVPQYNKGGMVQKHGSSTCVRSKFK